MPQAKILVVDDEPDVVRALTMRLRNAGHEVLSANDGNEAALMVEKVIPDLVILDIGMPKADGHTVARNLLKNDSTSRIPIIFLTARTSESDRLRASDAGVCRYITKPFKSEELLDTVGRALSCIRRPLRSFAS